MTAYDRRCYSRTKYIRKDKLEKINSGQDDPLSTIHRAIRLIILLMALVSLVLYLAPILLTTLGFRTSATLDTILSQHLNREYRYAIGLGDNPSIGQASIGYRFDQTFVNETVYRLDRLDAFKEIQGWSLVMPLLQPWGITPSDSVSLQSTVGMNEQGLLSSWQINGQIGDQGDA